jgi:copper homeostasis protein
MKLEICANSYQSALNAEKAGADRIELCSELSVGGITPSYGLLKVVSENITIPVFVLIRPRSGNFNYSDAEFDIIKNNIKLCKKLGLKGIVSGVLNDDNTIDIKRTQELIELSSPLSFTFHRAFDCVPNPKESLQELLNLRVNRILTSGQKKRAIDGIELLMELQQLAQEKLIIIPGGGINDENASHFKENGFKEIHSSASKIIQSSKSSYFDEVQKVSSTEIIKSILKIIR